MTGTYEVGRELFSHGLKPLVDHQRSIEQAVRKLSAERADGAHAEQPAPSDRPANRT